MAMLNNQMVYKMVANQTQSPSFCVWINYSQQLQFLVSYIGYIYIYKLQLFGELQ